MPGLSVLRTLALACVAAIPLGACVSAAANPSAERASELATLVSRSVACRAGAPRATTLERFIAAERARGATAEQLASARATYVTISEAETINQSVRPQPCDPDERAAIKAKMAPIRAGDFSAL